MDTRLTKPPAGVTLGPLSARIFAVLAEHTAFPWPVMKTQAQRHGLDPANLTLADLRALLDVLAVSVERFTSPVTGAKTREDLARLLESEV
jgi:hypothetical protein